MKKQFLCLLLVLSAILAVSAYPASDRTIDVYPHLEFNGTKANCSVTILGERTTDKISATMELWQGNNTMKGGDFGHIKEIFYGFMICTLSAIAIKSSTLKHPEMLNAVFSVVIHIIAVAAPCSVDVIASPEMPFIVIG